MRQEGGDKGGTDNQQSRGDDPDRRGDRLPVVEEIGDRTCALVSIRGVAKGIGSWDTGNGRAGCSQPRRNEHQDDCEHQGGGRHRRVLPTRARSWRSLDSIFSASSSSTWS